jgi:hypothetical protein
MAKKMKKTGTVLTLADREGLGAFLRQYTRLKDVPDRDPDWPIEIDGKCRRATTPDDAVYLLAEKYGLPNVDEWAGKYDLDDNGEFMLRSDIWDKVKNRQKRILKTMGKKESNPAPPVSDDKALADSLMKAIDILEPLPHDSRCRVVRAASELFGLN